jgi:hypothetical protein
VHVKKNASDCPPPFLRRFLDQPVTWGSMIFWY